MLGSSTVDLASYAIHPGSIQDPVLRAIYASQLEILTRAKRDSDIRMITTGIGLIGGIVALLNLSKLLAETQKVRRSRRAAASSPAPAAAPSS